MEGQNEFSHGGCIPGVPVAEAIKIQLLQEPLLACGDGHWLLLNLSSQGGLHLGDNSAGEVGMTDTMHVICMAFLR